MPISIRCPKCGATYRVPDTRAGQAGKCRCGEPIQIPTSPRTGDPDPTATSSTPPPAPATPRPQPSSSGRSRRLLGVLLTFLAVAASAVAYVKVPDLMRGPAFELRALPPSAAFRAPAVGGAVRWVGLPDKIHVVYDKQGKYHTLVHLHGSLGLWPASMPTGFWVRDLSPKYESFLGQGDAPNFSWEVASSATSRRLSLAETEDLQIAAGAIQRQHTSPSAHPLLRIVQEVAEFAGYAWHKHSVPAQSVRGECELGRWDWVVVQGRFAATRIEAGGTRVESEGILVDQARCSRPPELTVKVQSAPLRGRRMSVVVDSSAKASLALRVWSMERHKWVAHLPGVEVPEGRSTIVWNGRSNAGGRLPRGRYCAVLVAVSSEGGVSECKVAPVDVR